MIGSVASNPHQARLQIEERLASLPLTFLPNRYSHWEFAAFPNMAAIYSNLARTCIVPEQDVFAGAVAAQMDQIENDEVIARAYRSYPALVRQHYFSLVLKEHFPLVVRSEQLDLDGVDILVVEGGRAYGIALSVETSAAHAWQSVKEKRHPQSPETLPVLFLYARRTDFCVGRFWLHYPDQWLEVRRWIDDYRLQDDWYSAQLFRQVIP